MSRRPLLPPILLEKPFTIEEARLAGLDRWHLEGDSWTRLGPSTYVRTGSQDDPMQRLEAARRRLPAGAAFSGLTAAWLHGLDVSPCNPIEATVPAGSGVSARAGLELSRSALDASDVVARKGLPATSMTRTLGDICGRLDLVKAVVIADEALHNRRVRLEDLASWVDANSRRHGIKNVRRVLTHVEPAAESPMESRLRMLLVLAGLPRPQAQVPIFDRRGRFAGRLDLYSEEQRLGIEYDGATHRYTLAADNRRHNLLLNAGVHLLRFSGPDVFGNPEGVVAQVRGMLEPARAGANGLLNSSQDVSAGGRG